MPLYEFQCTRCGARDEVFVRAVTTDVHAPTCPNAASDSGHEMQRVISRFARHYDATDKLAQAEAKFGKQVEGVMGPGPDVGRMARRYEKLAKDLPPPDVPVAE